MKDSISKDLVECRSMLLEVLGGKDTTSFEPKNIVMDVKLWQFRGENPDAWIVQAEHYFNFYKIEEDQKLNVALFYLDGEALEWYQWLFRNNQLIDWMHFAEKRKYVSLQEVPSVTEYPNRLEVVSSDFCQSDILSPCLAHVTDSPLPQNYDEQSEYPIKIDEHKVFDEMLNSNCPKVFTVALDAPFEILDEDVIGPDGSKVQLFYGHPQIDMSERRHNESGTPISELLSDEMTSKDMALTGYTVNAETLLLLGSSCTFYFIIYANHMTQVWDPGRRWCGAYATTYRTFVQSIEEQPVEHESLTTYVITGGVACVIGNLESAKGTAVNLSVLEVSNSWFHSNTKAVALDSPSSLDKFTIVMSRWLHSNLEDKVLFEGGSIVVNPM
ncbi:hypothetical protein KY285_029724 [Solanum tuberosum]|nr:hypothetical protein KY285_029724 [Solanum tuberosum]